MGMIGGILTREMHDNQGFEGKKMLLSSDCSPFCWLPLFSFLQPDDEGIAESGMWWRDIGTLGQL